MILPLTWYGGCLLRPEILYVVESQDVGTGHADLENFIGQKLVEP